MSGRILEKRASNSMKIMDGCQRERARDGRFDPLRLSAEKLDKRMKHWSVEAYRLVLSYGSGYYAQLANLKNQP